MASQEILEMMKRKFSIAWEALSQIAKIESPNTATHFYAYIQAKHRARLAIARIDKLAGRFADNDIARELSMIDPNDVAKILEQTRILFEMYQQARQQRDRLLTALKELDAISDDMGEASQGIVARAIREASNWSD